MKLLICLIGLFTCTLSFSQAIELEQNPPMVKVLDNNDDIGAELGYFNQDGYQLKLYDEGGNQTVRLAGGIDQQRFGELILFNQGDPTIRFIGNYGQTNFGRVITDQLEITGGADLAEYFEVGSTQKVTPGCLTSIDQNNQGNLTITSEPYDQKIVGIVSGANGVGTGMFMGHQGSIANGSHPIALTGRAYVLAVSENGPIQPGDFLTSSSTPGYAMKVKKLRKAKGAIIGKAMSRIDENGFVLVLINLQ